jgi:hypothetical protein
VRKVTCSAVRVIKCVYRQNEGHEERWVRERDRTKTKEVKKCKLRL